MCDAHPWSSGGGSSGGGGGGGVGCFVVIILVIVGITMMSDGSENESSQSLGGATQKSTTEARVHDDRTVVGEWRISTSEGKEVSKAVFTANGQVEADNFSENNLWKGTYSYSGRDFVLSYRAPRVLHQVKVIWIDDNTIRVPEAPPPQIDGISGAAFIEGTVNLTADSPIPNVRNTHACKKRRECLTAYTFHTFIRRFPCPSTQWNAPSLRN